MPVAFCSNWFYLLVISITEGASMPLSICWSTHSKKKQSEFTIQRKKNYFAKMFVTTKYTWNHSRLSKNWKIHYAMGPFYRITFCFPPKVYSSDDNNLLKFVKKQTNKHIHLIYSRVLYRRHYHEALGFLSIRLKKLCNSFSKMDR